MRDRTGRRARSARARRGGGRRRGVALLLALLAATVAAVVAYSFIAAQSTSIEIARNIKSHGEARYVAETGLELTMAYLRANSDWRTVQSQGTWVADEPFGTGTFTVVAEDGRDADDDGAISQPAEGDGDLSDDGADLLTLTVTGKVNGVTHVVRVVVTPVPALGGLLLVIPAGAPSASDEARIQFLQNKGWTVDTIADSVAQGAVDVALAAANVVCVSSTAAAVEIDTKLSSTPIGVVSEQPELADELDVVTAAATYTGSQIEITDNDPGELYGITTTLSLGALTVTSADQPLAAATGTLHAAGIVLAERSGSADPALVLLEASPTFGETTAHTTQHGQNKNKIVGSKVTLSEIGTVSSVTAYIKGAPPKSARFALYTDGGGEPGTLIAQSDPINAEGVWYWCTGTFASPPTLAPGAYWLAVHFSGNSHKWASGGTGAIRYRDSNYGSGPPDPWGASDGSDTTAMSIYASYTPGSVAAATIPGRRVFMPWGGDGFDFTQLTADGSDLLANALRWAGRVDEDGGAGGNGYTYTSQWQPTP